MPLSMGVAFAAATLPLLAMAVGPRAASADPTLRVRLDQGWRFSFGASEQHPDRPIDATWESVDLPHTWNREDAFGKENTFREGPGWYRRSIAIDPAWRGRRLVLRCEGANQVTDVWWNDRRVGHHAGGYTAFNVDVTDAVDFAGANRLQVRVDNRIGPVPPLIADYNFYGGLYRSVWLLVLDPVHFATTDHGAPGAWVEARDVSQERATMVVRGRVTNATDTPVHVEVTARVRAPDGALVATTHATLDAPAAAETAFELPAQALHAPQLWSPGAPHLYEVEIELRVRDRATDVVRLPLGLRYFAVDPAGGLTLNGQPLRLNGTNRHQDRAGFGNAVPESLQREDLRRIKADGFDFVRLAHYPQSDAVLEECDRLGLVVWEEIPVVNRADTSAAFAANARGMLVEMIRQHRMHPSVLFWGVANEVLLLKPDPLPAGYVAHTAALVRGLRDLARAEDPSRLTALAVSYDELDDGSGIQDLTDVLGLNLYFGWYYRTLDELGPWLDRFHAAHPRRPVIVSEYGADGDARVHARAPHAMDFSAEYEQAFHEASFPQFAARRWLVGTAVWNQFDFGSRRRDGTRPGFNQKGLYSFDRRPKDVAFYYRARLARDPVLHLAIRDWPRRAGSRAADARQTIRAYSNADSVELFLAGATLGSHAVANGVATWDVTLRAGSNELAARARRDGRTLEDAGTLDYENREPAAPHPSGGLVIAVSASDAQYVEDSGQVWEPCREYDGRGWGRMGGRPVVTRHRILDTDDDALYQSTIEGIDTLRFDVPAGEYELELRFTVPHDECVMDVTVNGEPFAMKYDPRVIFHSDAKDVVATTGEYRAVARRGRVQADARGLRVAFTALRGRTTWSAARLLRR